MPVVTRSQRKNTQNVAQVNLLKDVTPIRQCVKDNIAKKVASELKIDNIEDAKPIVKKVLKAVKDENGKLVVALIDIEEPIEKLTKSDSSVSIATTPVQTNNNGSDEYFEFKKKAINFIKDKLEECDCANGKQNKLNIAIEIFEYVLNTFSKLFEKEPSIWIKFMTIVYLKAVDFENENKLGDYNICDFDSVQKLMNTSKKLKEYIAPHIVNKNFNIIFETNLGSNTHLNNLIKAREIIEKEKSQRKLRDGKRINYKGMGGGYVMDPSDYEMGFDPNPAVEIYLKTAEVLAEMNDPDYVFEDDEDEDEDDEDYVRDNYMNILY
jgi:hypothetical protein